MKLRNPEQHLTVYTPKADGESVTVYTDPGSWEFDPEFDRDNILALYVSDGDEYSEYVRVSADDLLPETDTDREALALLDDEGI
jgi:hypothetical protein